MGCTANPRSTEATPDDPEPPAQTPSVPGVGSPPAPEPPQASPPAPALPSKHCSADASRGEPWAALDALLHRVAVAGDFGCPAQFQLVQRRPWRDAHSLTPPGGRGGTVFEFVGHDPESGDNILATVGKMKVSTKLDRTWAERGELDQHAYFNVVPEQPSRPLSLQGPKLAMGRWYSLRLAVRKADEIEALVRWLGTQTDLQALDVVTIDPNVFEGGELATTTVVHHLAGSTATVCTISETTRCWSRKDVRRSLLETDGQVDTEIDVLTRSGRRTKVAVDDEGALTPSDGWEHLETLPPGLATVAPLPGAKGAAAVRLVGRGLVTVAEYQHYGHATDIRQPMVRWVLAREGGTWTATPTPTMILRNISMVGDAMAIEEARRLASAAGTSDSRRILMFVRDGGQRHYVGQLPAVFGEDDDSAFGAYTWTHTLAPRGRACVAFEPGPFRGVTYDLETEIESSIDGRVRKLFAKTPGPWTIGSDGIVAGCRRRPSG